jgi:hypothetical protein
MRTLITYYNRKSNRTDSGFLGMDDIIVNGIFTKENAQKYLDNNGIENDGVKSVDDV